MDRNYSTFRDNIENDEEAPLLNENAQPTSGNTTVINDEENNMQPQNTIRPNINSEDLTWKKLLINMLNHLLVISVTIFVAYKSFQHGIVLFAWHPPLMVLGFFILMTEAVLAFSDNNLTNKLGYKKRVYWHWILHTIGCCSIVAGFVIIFANKYRMDKPHFHTNHAIVGLTAIICTVLSASGGILAKYSFQLRTYLRPVYSKIFHALLGISTYILGMAAIILGLYSEYFMKISSIKTVYVLTAIVIFITINVVLKPLILVYARIKASLTQSAPL